ncbi:hypothetical protein E2C01_047109 [Portunus trituberculatus]|uniref:Uncharacterized protein n=1 Tax=Portunus trituberculatus TaxID=210409 RepID=A0A5B7FZJ1_PORTR|nr:hypothetical protein [Portunus trituberculatus]
MQHNTEHLVGIGDIQDPKLTLRTQRWRQREGGEEHYCMSTTHFCCLFEERNCIESTSHVARSSSGLSDQIKVGLEQSKVSLASKKRGEEHREVEVEVEAVVVRSRFRCYCTLTWLSTVLGGGCARLGLIWD